jgi:methylmalonyl-CoA mutase, N-terminal domain
MQQVDDQGGAVTAIERGFVQNAIAENAYRREVARSSGDEVVVGVNKYAADEGDLDMALHSIDPEVVARQTERVTRYKQKQERRAVNAALDRVRRAAEGTDNLLPVMKEALLAGATLGQTANALRDVFGEHKATL